MSPAPGKHFISLGLALIGIALLTLLATTAIDKPSLASTSEPGPTAFPAALAIILLAGGIHELLKWWKTRSPKVAGTSVPESHVSGPLAPPSPFTNQNLLIFIAALILYIPALQWLGFFFSSLILAGGLAWRLGSRPWIAIVTSVALLLVVQILFGTVFKVPLPQGPFGF